MCSRLHLAALGALLLAALQTPKAESRSSVLHVRVNVVRACAVDTRGAGEVGTISLTCSGGGATGVVSAGAGPNARVIPVPARQTTVVSTRSILQTGAMTPEGTRERQVITVNF